MNSFYGKLATTLLLIFFMSGGVLYVLTTHISNRYENEVSQKLHADLAKKIIEEKIKITDETIDIDALKMTFMNLMVLGPAFEFYLLDPDGSVKAYSADPNKIKRTSVKLEPIRTFLGSLEKFPIRGDDPRSETGQKIFSAATIVHNDRLIGYLYVIIGGEIYDNVVDTVIESKILSSGFMMLIGVGLVSILVLLSVFALLTKPLRQLSNDMDMLKANGFREEPQVLTPWNSQGDEIQRLGANFNEMAQVLKQQFDKVKTVDDVRKELIAHVSHDLRTPLAALLGYLETWQLYHSELSQEEGAQLIHTANENGQKINRLVEQLFELARLDQDTVPLHIEPVAIAELAGDVIQNLSGMAEERQVTLNVIPLDSSVRVMGDIPKLERALTNLLDNAIRHCQQGDKVTVELTPEGNRVEIAVKDTGIGIPEAELKNVINPHYQAQNSVKGKTGNAGLGLTITDKILQLHDSELVAYSKEHQGARFSFMLARAIEFTA